MSNRFEELKTQLAQEMAKGVTSGPPSGITRHNLNEMRRALPVVVCVMTLENEYANPKGIAIGDDFYKELHDAEVAAYKARGQDAGEAMSWQDVRDTYILYFQAVIDAISPAGVAKRKAALKAEEEANIATPTLNAMKTTVPETVIQNPTDAQLVS